jgi:hypothetical protein
MTIFIHTYVINKTYILVSYLSFGDKIGEIKPILAEQTWRTTLFYLATFSIIFILIFAIGLITT